jgi:hypothetical protein
MRARDPRDRPGIERQQRRFHRLVDGDGAAAALGDLQRLAIAQAGQPPIELAQIAGGERADIGVDGGRGGALVFAPFRHEIGRARNEETWREPLHRVAHGMLMGGVEKGPEETDGDRLDAAVDEPADRRLRLGLVERHHHLAEAIDALGDALDQALGHDRIGLPAFREMHDLAHVAPADAARAPHDMDDVTMAFGGDQPDARAALLHHGVGSNRGAVRQQRHLLIEVRSLHPQLFRSAGNGVDHALGEIAGRGRRLGGGHRAAFVDDDAVGESAADIDTHEIRTHLPPPDFPTAFRATLGPLPRRRKAVELARVRERERFVAIGADLAQRLDGLAANIADADRLLDGG